MDKKTAIETIAAHLGHYDRGAGLSPRLEMSTTYRRNTDNLPMRENSIYGRDHNETVRHAEDVLAQLEQAYAALLWPSGMAAIASVIRTLHAGQTLLIQSGIYWGTTQWVRRHTARFGITLIEADLADPTNIPDCCPDMIFVETPSNPWLRVTDIAGIKARFPNAILVVDSTAATPVLTRPLTLGADLVIHSATKALNGHSDVLAGVVLCAQHSKMWEEIAQERATAGAIIAPQAAWLLLRSLRTLSIRMRQMCENAQNLAEFLMAHDGVEDVFYPGLPHHSQYDLAQRQMQGGQGYLMSVLIKGGRTAALGVLAQLEVFQRATSLGGVESLVEHRHTIEPDTGIPENLLRLSVGIENIQDLMDDFDQALQAIHA